MAAALFRPFFRSSSSCSASPASLLLLAAPSARQLVVVPALPSLRLLHVACNGAGPTRGSPLALTSPSPFILLSSKNGLLGGVMSRSMTAIRDRKRKARENLPEEMKRPTQAIEMKAGDQPAPKTSSGSMALAVAKSSTGKIVDPWVPAESKLPSLFSRAGIKYRMDNFKKRSFRTTVSFILIGRSCPDFAAATFPKFAQDAYIRAFNAILSDDKQVLRELVTEDAYVALRSQFRGSVKKWVLAEGGEPPRIAQAATFAVMDKKNMFAQIIVRLHLKKVFPTHVLPKAADTEPSSDIVDYVVFERHISNAKGSWRICGKVPPNPLDLALNASPRPDKSAD